MADIMRRPRSLFEWPVWFPRQWAAWPELRLPMEDLIQVEEFKEDGTLVVKAEIPGIDPDKDVEITVHEGALEIKAERRQEERFEKDETYRTEFRYGMFTRRVPLPPGATQDQVSATYRDGILEVRIPITEERETPKKVPITHG